MKNTQGSAHSAVLIAYASAGKRAAQALQVKHDLLQPGLDAARQALQSARAIDLKALESALERSIIQACQKVERGERQAGTDHGQAMTVAVSALSARRATIEGERELFLREARERHALACTTHGAEDAPGCLPALDALQELELQATALCGQQEALSRSLYEETKRDEDIRLADRRSDLYSEKASTIETARAAHEAAVAALLEPLEAKVASLQAEFDETIGAAQAVHNAARRERLEILATFERGLLLPEDAIASLDRLSPFVF